MNNLLYIPNGYSLNSLQGLNFTTINPAMGFFTVNNQSNFGWNTSNILGLSYNNNTLLSDISKASQSGESEKSKVLSAILVYGPTIAAMVSQIILATKGKSVTNPNEISDQEARELLLKLNGNFSPENINQTYSAALNGSNNILGIPLNTILFALGGILLLKLANN